MTDAATGVPHARPDDELRDELADYWSAVTADEVEAATAVLDRAAERHPGTDVLATVVGATQVRVGRLWQEGEWSVAQEHAATAVSERVVRDRLERALAQQSSSPAAPPVVVTCAEREWHALPGLLLAAALAGRGVPVVHLGADVSAQRLHGALLDAPAAAVLVSASLASSLLRVRAQVETARSVGTPVVVGGHAFDAGGRRAAALGATAQAADPVSAAELLPTLPRHVPPATAIDHEGVVEAALLDADTARVVDEVRDRVLTATGAADGDESWTRVLGDQLPHLVGSLAGALLVRDDTIVSQAEVWLGAVLTRRSAPPSVVDDVWGALRETLRDFPAACDLLAAGRP